MRPFRRLITALACTYLLTGCEPLPPPLSEQDIPVLDTTDVEYEEERLRMLTPKAISVEQERNVLAVARSATARYIEARSHAGTRPEEGVFRGPLALHTGWRQEFFPLARETYEGTYPLKAGSLYHDPSPTGAFREIGSGWMVRGVLDGFTGFLTRIIDVPEDGFYTFSVDSDDGTIGTLQRLPDGLHDVQLLWYDWYTQAMEGRLSETRDVHLAAGRYLLTVHYFEDGGKAGYHVVVRHQAPPLSEDQIPTLRAIDIEYDESRLHVFDRSGVAEEQEQVVLAVSRAAMARYIGARSGSEPSLSSGLFEGPINLHTGWREEFFPFGKEAYEEAYPLPAGTLYFEPNLSVVSRDVASVGGVLDGFSAFLTRVIEVPSDGFYTFGVDSDDGTIGVLQRLPDGIHELRVLWYDWRTRAIFGHLAETEDVHLEAGTYLLTVHYFEGAHLSGYRITSHRQPASDGP